MSVKHSGRRAAIDELLAYLLPRLEAEEPKGVYRNGLLNAYSYESGISIRVLREYVDVLSAAGKIRQDRSGHWPVLRRAEAS